MSKFEIGAVCTKEKPNHNAQIHPDAKCVGTDEDWEFGISYDVYDCPNCGVVFKVELPQ